jgi:hypothetical protein
MPVKGENKTDGMLQTEALVLLPQASDVLLESFKHEDAMGDEEEEESMQPPTRPNSQS